MVLYQKKHRENGPTERVPCGNEWLSEPNPRPEHRFLPRVQQTNAICPKSSMCGLGRWNSLSNHLVTASADHLSRPSRGLTLLLGLATAPGKLYLTGVVLSLVSPCGNLPTTRFLECVTVPTIGALYVTDHFCGTRRLRLLSGAA